ncbi:hypothetical protein CGX12_11865 [Zobellella denitrificans]|uniref:hypothetical protein n=1 Tax=Zobellella denitrificans TaxID=347534 RepID=UPI000B8C076B|nr:hypothetical protein [Zobellella denitrificans]OXS14909.1 hypothetical protein CGX12_11865 [Zobellella denitrificans]
MMAKYSGFTVEHMLWFVAQQGLKVEAKTVEVAPGETGWKITLTGDEVQVFDGTTLFMATMRAFKQFSDQATRERKEAQAALNKIMRMARKPNHPDHELCSVCCGYGCTEAGDICEGCDGSGRGEVAQ